jgi:hypothetical protein
VSGVASSLLGGSGLGGALAAVAGAAATVSGGASLAGGAVSLGSRSDVADVTVTGVAVSSPGGGVNRENLGGGVISPAAGTTESGMSSDVGRTG